MCGTQFILDRKCEFKRFGIVIIDGMKKEKDPIVAIVASALPSIPTVRYLLFSAI